MGARRGSNVVTNASLLICERACTYIYTHIVYTCVFTNLSSKVLADSKRLNHRVVCRRFLDVGRCVDGTISCDFLFALRAGLDHKAMNESLLLTGFRFLCKLMWKLFKQHSLRTNKEVRRRGKTSNHVYHRFWDMIYSFEIYGFINDIQRIFAY